jgi:serine/threonine protein phosphatase PrpC
MTTHRFHVFGCTDTGLVRPANEDHILVGRFIKNSGSMELEFSVDDDFMGTYGMLFCVADGIGGGKAGEVASKLALQTIERHFYGFEKQADCLSTFTDAIQAAGKRANDTVMQVAASRLEYRGMGCTLTGICLTGNSYIVFNAGDSRVYRFRNGILKQLTDDDTLVNIALRAGQMTYEEAANSDARHTITNSIGFSSFNMKIAEGPDIRDEDRLLLCSDGVHDLVHIERMEEIISGSDVAGAARKLVAEAKINGGHDNISLILIHFFDFEETEEIEPKTPEKEQEMDKASETFVTSQDEVKVELLGEGEGNDN